MQWREARDARAQAELEKLLGAMGSRSSGLEHFSILHEHPAEPPAAPSASERRKKKAPRGATPPTSVPQLRVRWTLAEPAAAASLARELADVGAGSLLRFDTAANLSGRAAVYGSLSLPRLLARHPVVTLLRGNPKAIALAVSLLQRDGAARQICEVPRGRIDGHGTSQSTSGTSTHAATCHAGGVAPGQDRLGCGV